MSATPINTATPCLTGKTALITGGSTGVGLEAAKRFAREGARIAITGTGTEELAAALRELPQGSLAIHADPAILRETATTMAQVRDAFGHLDTLFINASIDVPAIPEKNNDAFLEQIFDVNFKGAFFTLQQAVPLMRRGSSVIINTSWMNPAPWQQQIHTPALWILTAMKAAVRSFAHDELTSRGIRVNAINSGTASVSSDGELFSTTETWQEMADRLQDQIPLGGLASMDEIVDAITFLASDDSLYMLSSELVVDGPITRM